MDGKYMLLISNAIRLTGEIFPRIHPVSSKAGAWDGIPEVSTLQKSLWTRHWVFPVRLWCVFTWKQIFKSMEVSDDMKCNQRLPGG